MVLKQKWLHDGWDYSQSMNCSALFVDRVMCHVKVSAKGVADNVIPKHIPISASFGDLFDRVYVVGDSTIRMLYATVGSRCNAQPLRNATLRKGLNHESISSLCGVHLLHVANVGTPGPVLQRINASSRALIIFNMAHTYLWFDRTDFLTRALKGTAAVLEEKQFPHLAVIKGPALNTNAWSNGKFGPFKGYSSRCTHNNLHAKRRFDETVTYFQHRSINLSVIDVFYESLANIQNCARDGIHFKCYVYDLMVDHLISRYGP